MMCTSVRKSRLANTPAADWRKASKSIGKFLISSSGAVIDHIWWRRDATSKGRIATNLSVQDASRKHANISATARTSSPGAARSKGGSTAHERLSMRR